MAVRYHLSYYLDHEWSNNKVLDEPGDDPDSILEQIAVCGEATNDNNEKGGETTILHQSKYYHFWMVYIQINANHLHTRLSFVDLQNWDGCASGLH